MEETDSQVDAPLVQDAAVTLESQSQRKEGCCCHYRYGLAVLNFCGFAMAVSYRVNFNIALVAMVNYTASDQYVSNECKEGPHTANHSAEKEGDFQWSAHEQGLLLGGFYYGYILTPLVGGYLAEEIGPKLILLVTVLVPSLINLITPVLADWNVNALLVSRIVMGIAQGPLYPASNVLWSKWAPVNEKTKMYTSSLSGVCVGSVLAPIITGALCDSDFLRGWPSSFYLFGLLGVVWSVLWFMFAHNSPETHTSLSPQEREYILRGRSDISKPTALRRPWRSMVTSGAVWAVLLFNTFDGLAYYSMFSGVPIYMKQILHLHITQDGATFALPYLGMFVVVITSGWLADQLRKYHFSTATIRKFMAFLGAGSQVGFIIGMGFLPCSRVAAISLYTVTTTVFGFKFSGPSTNFLDIAPKYAGTLVGVSNFLQNVGGFVSPLIVGAITKESPDRKEWQIVFFLTAAAYALGTLAFLILAKGEEEEWAKHGTETLAKGGGPVLSVNSGDIQRPNDSATASIDAVLIQDGAHTT